MTMKEPPHEDIHEDALSGDPKSAVQYNRRSKINKSSEAHGFLFQDPKSPHKVYKVVKALYVLIHQAPRACMQTISSLFLLKNGYRIGTIDKTSLFLKKDKHDIILVQVYVDDIIFGSTKKSWCNEFEALMKSRFQMSSMGELTFFLGLQVKQKPNGIFHKPRIRSMIGHLDIVIMLEQILIGNPQQKVVNFWQETHYLAMQKANHVATSNNRSRIFAAANFAVGANLIDSKSQC
ncbi:putative ribonuclease H-like domain-containing protein [Tanacetum coccineum]